MIPEEFRRKKTDDNIYPTQKKTNYSRKTTFAACLTLVLVPQNAMWHV